MLKKLLKRNTFTIEDGLLHAVSGFQSTLSDDQKAEFQDSRRYTRQNLPSDRDVYSLRLAYGTRLLSILQSAQQFATLGNDAGYDTRKFVTCDPWVVLKFCLQYFVRQRVPTDAVTQVFMALERSAPRYQELPIYCIDSEELRRSLVEYFVVVVELCHDVWRISLGSTGLQTPQLILAAAEAKYARLDAWKKSIQREMTSLNATDYLIVDHSDKRFSSTCTDEQKRRMMRMRQEYKNNILKELSPCDNQIGWQRILRQATPPLYKDPAFLDWKQKKGSATLIYAGKSGVGKSTMLAIITDYLRIYDSDGMIAHIAHFFCTYDDPKSLEPRNILGSLMQQVLYTFPAKVFTKPVPVYENEKDQVLLQYFISYLSKARFTKVFFVLDGLHHCSRNSRSRVLQCLQELQRNIPLLVCISATDGTNKYNDFDSLADVSRISVSVEPSRMNKFIKIEVGRHRKATLPGQTDEVSITTSQLPEIYEAISQLPEINYPLLRLYLLYLCRIDLQDTLWESPTKLPTNLSELLSQLIRYGNPYYDVLHRLIELLVAAVEPLTLDQLRYAIRIDSAATLGTESILSDIDKALDYYNGIFLIDEVRLTVHIAHGGIMNCLLSESTPNKFINKDIAHQRLAKICLASLTSEPHEILPVNPEKTSPKQSSGKISLDSQHLPSLRKDLETSSIFSTSSQSTLVPEPPHKDTPSSFHKYISQHWLQHFTYIPPEDTPTINLARKVFTQHPHTLNHPGSPSESLVHWSLSNNHTTILTLALQSGMHAQAYPHIISAVQTNDLTTLQTLLPLHHFNLNSLSCSNEPLLCLALERGHTEIFTYLISHGCTFIDKPDSKGRTALWYAASKGEIAKVKVILDTKLADVNARDVYAMTPLAAAVMGRRADVVEALLMQPGINTRTLDDDFRTPLQTAVQYGFEREVELLEAFEEKVRASKGTRKVDG